MKPLPAMATTKMSLGRFAALSLIGLVLDYVVIFSSILGMLFISTLGVIGLLAVPIYGVLVIILFGISFFRFKKDPDNNTYRSLIVLFAPALLSILGVIAAYFVLRGRKAL
jgi:hypothetical protein